MPLALGRSRRMRLISDAPVASSISLWGRANLRNAPDRQQDQVVRPPGLLEGRKPGDHPAEGTAFAVSTLKQLAVGPPASRAVRGAEESLLQTITGAWIRDASGFNGLYPENEKQLAEIGYVPSIDSLPADVQRYRLR